MDRQSKGSRGICLPPTAAGKQPPSSASIACGNSILASELGVSHEKIHLNAEEMEHILTPDIEERLTRLLANPKVDPHSQPIPERSFL